MAAFLLLGYAVVAVGFYATLRSRAPLMDSFDEPRAFGPAEVVELFPEQVRKAA